MRLPCLSNAPTMSGLNVQSISRGQSCSLLNSKGSGLYFKFDGMFKFPSKGSSNSKFSSAWQLLDQLNISPLESFCGLKGLLDRSASNITQFGQSLIKLKHKKSSPKYCRLSSLHTQSSYFSLFGSQNCTALFLC